MAQHQSIQARLRQNLRDGHSAACAEGRAPTMSEIMSKQIPYLEANIEETLRRSSVATLIVRKATRDTQILGYNIPKGTDVIIPLTGPSLTEPALNIPDTNRPTVYRRTENRVKPWPDDDIMRYNPDRWMKLKTDNAGEETAVFDPQAGPNLAFSVGPRQCFGKKQARLQLQTVATLLLWEFTFEALEKSLNTWEIEERLVNLPKQCFVKLATAS